MEKQIFKYLKLLEYDRLVDIQDEEQFLVLLNSPSKPRKMLIEYCFDLINSEFVSSDSEVRYVDIYDYLGLNSHSQNSKGYEDQKKKIEGRSSKEDSISTLAELLQFTYYHCSVNKSVKLGQAEKIIGYCSNNFSQLFKPKIKLSLFEPKSNMQTNQEQEQLNNEKIIKETVDYRSLNSKVNIKLAKLKSQYPHGFLETSQEDYTKTKIMLSKLLEILKEFQVNFTNYLRDNLRWLNNSDQVEVSRASINKFDAFKLAFQELMQEIVCFFSLMEKASSISII